MKLLGKFLLAVFCYSSWAASAGVAQSVIVDTDHVNLSNEFQFYIDETGELTLPELMVYTDRYPFVLSSEARPDTGRSVLWLRLDLEFAEELRQEVFYLSSLTENLYDIRVYLPDNEDGYYELITGNDYPAASRDVDSSRYSFRIDPLPDANTVIYVRLQGGPGMDSLRWVLSDSARFIQDSWDYYRINLVSLSAIGTMLIFNTFIAVSLRRGEYGWYSFYLATVMFALFAFEGMGFYHLWPNIPWLNDRALLCCNLISVAARLMVVVRFLDLNERMPRINHWVSAFAAVLGCFAVVVFAVGMKVLPELLPSLVWGFGSLVGLLVCFAAVRAKIRLALPLSIALLIPFIAAMAQAAIALSAPSDSALSLQVAKFGFVAHVLVFSLCLAAQIKTEMDNHRRALHDDLTGLPRLNLFQHQFSQSLSLVQRREKNLGVIFIDLDGFKLINDGYGHRAGDELLKMVAERIKGELRRHDVAARLGGDEFAVLLMEIPRRDTLEPIVDRLLQSISEPYYIDGVKMNISASIGIALAPVHGESLDELLTLADDAMYRVKGDGKNAYAWAETPMQQAA